MTLRESIEALREFIGGASYPGPEAGRLAQPIVVYPDTIKQDLFGAPPEEKDPKAYKDRFAGKRKRIRATMHKWQNPES